MLSMSLGSMEESGFALPFEVISMLLLAAMVGCIVIAMREKRENLNTEQKNIKRNTHLFIV